MQKEVSNADTVFVNCTITGDDFTQAVYDVTYDQPLLKTPSDYFLSILKFSIPLENIPLLLLPNQRDNEQFLDAPIYTAGTASQAGNTVTGVSTNFTAEMTGGEIRWGATTATIQQVVNATTLTVTPAQAVPLGPFEIRYPNILTTSNLVVGLVQNTVPPAPAPAWTPFGRPVLAGSYSYSNVKTNLPNPIFSYSEFAFNVNNALNNAWIDAGSPGSTTPTFYWSATNKSFIFELDLDTFNAGWTIYVNPELNTIIRGFDNIFVEDPIENRYHLVIDPSPRTIPENVNLVPTWDPEFQVPTDRIAVKPDFVALDYFSSLRKILIVSNGIPAQKEYFPVAGTAQQSGLPNTLGVIADFQIDISNNPGSQGGIALFDTELIIPIDLLSSSPLRKIDFQLYWTDRLNNLYPIFLAKDQTVSVKLGFFRKELLLNQHFVE